MDSCFYCENGEKRRSLMIEICELPCVRISLNRDQKHPGRCVVELKAHKTEYFQLTKKECEAYFRAVVLTAKAIDEIYHPDKINYATYGDLVPHVHMHIVPKYKNGIQWGKPFDDAAEKRLLSEVEYAQAVETLRAKIYDLHAMNVQL